MEILQTTSKRLYKYIEKPVVNFIGKFPVVIRFLCGVARNKLIANLKITSREELQYLISESGRVLSSEEKQLIINSLSFADRKVRDVMTPRSMVSTVARLEFLGPLNLDDLYKKSGHSHLPVIDGDVDHVIGILNLKNLLNLDTKQSSTAEQIMDKRIFYIRQDQSLDYALGSFLKSHFHLFIVINEFRETVGILSLGDVIEELIGRSVNDCFDAQDDIHTVALRNPMNNNRRTNSRVDI
jgi:CBS domain containing-hemolysin-like protein